MVEWKINNKVYLEKILSVSVVPDFFKKIIPQQNLNNLCFLACGPGYELNSIDEAFPGYFNNKLVYLVDNSKKLTEKIEETIENLSLDYLFLRKDMTKTEIKESTIDMVFCINGLIYEDLIPRVLKEAKRILKPGGFFVANTYPPYEQMDGGNLPELKEFRERFENPLGTKYIAPKKEGGNGYFNMAEGYGNKQVLISDNNMSQEINNQDLSIKESFRYNLPEELVNKLRGFPISALKKSPYQTSAWLMRKKE